MLCSVYALCRCNTVAAWVAALVLCMQMLPVLLLLMRMLRVLATASLPILAIENKVNALRATKMLTDSKGKHLKLGALNTVKVLKNYKR